MVEGLVEARYSKNKREILKQVNLNLEKIRILLRICYELKYLPTASYEHAMSSLQEIGRMLGGWLKQAHESSSHETAARAF